MKLIMILFALSTFNIYASVAYYKDKDGNWHHKDMTELDKDFDYVDMVPEEIYHDYIEEGKNPSELYKKSEEKEVKLPEADEEKLSKATSRDLYYLREILDNGQMLSKFVGIADFIPFFTTDPVSVDMVWHIWDTDFTRAPRAFKYVTVYIYRKVKDNLQIIYFNCIQKQLGYGEDGKRIWQNDLRFWNNFKKYWGEIRLV